MIEVSDVPAGAHVVAAPAEIDFATAPALAAELAAALAEHGDVVLDCAGTTFCDSTALKVLLAAKRLARALDVELRIVDPPRVLLRIAGILQASELLGLPRPSEQDGP
jgi:anti-anti-sigma factor